MNTADETAAPRPAIFVKFVLMLSYFLSFLKTLVFVPGLFAAGSNYTYELGFEELAFELVFLENIPYDILDV